jgi:hypothetical protein
MSGVHTGPGATTFARMPRLMYPFGESRS